MNKFGIALFISLFLQLNTNSYAEAVRVDRINPDAAATVSSKNSKPTSNSKPVNQVSANKEKAKLGNSFKDLDKNADNVITFDEFFQHQELKERKRSEDDINRLLTQCDKNEDGMISRDELPKEKDMNALVNDITMEVEAEVIEERMKKRCFFPVEAMEFVDLNGDGSVTRDEMIEAAIIQRRPSRKMEKKFENKRQKREAKLKEKKFSRCDSNGDLILSFREIQSMKCGGFMLTEEFDSRDENKDDFLSKEEYLAIKKPNEFIPPGQPSEAERRKKMRPLLRLEMSMNSCDKDEDGRLGLNETIDEACEVDTSYFNEVDHNQDGYISFDEIKRIRMKKSFDRMDKNKDGVLDNKEYRR